MGDDRHPDSPYRDILGDDNGILFRSAALDRS